MIHAISPSLPTPAGIKVDKDFLLRKVSTLRLAERRRRNWDEHGEKITREFPISKPAFRLIGEDGVSSEVTATPNWEEAKDLIQSVFTSTDPKYDGIRKRLRNLHNPSTQMMLSVLSIWLSGEMGISTSMTHPMVALILYGSSVSSVNLMTLGGR
jgi:hypothetical protein